MAILFVVATPIGNLGDLSPRAAGVLGEVRVVAAESLTRTRKLLSHLGLGGKRLISCREANRAQAANQVVEALDQGQDVALVSDAGTPGVSDPGGLVVERAAAAGHRLCPLPGPSSLAAALSVAGLPGAPLVFLGFLPAKPGPRRQLLAQARDTGWPMVLFEAPHRLAATAQDLAQLMGPRRTVVCRELSKLHEEVEHTTCSQLAQRLEQGPVKGEITLVVEGGEPPRAGADELDRLLREELERDLGGPSKMARRVAALSGQPRDLVYRRLLEIKEREKAGSPGTQEAAGDSETSDQEHEPRDDDHEH